MRSVYEFESKGVVSIWVATVPRAEIPKDYFTEHCDRDDDEPFNQFSADFGFGFYDHDFVDTNGVTDKTMPIERLLGECSYGASYMEQAAAAATAQGLHQTEFVFLLHDVAYRPEITGGARSDCMAFLGSFPYDSESSSAFDSMA